MTKEMKFDLLYQKMVEEQYVLKKRLANMTFDEMLLCVYQYTERWSILDNIRGGERLSEEEVDVLLKIERPLEVIYYAEYVRRIKSAERNLVYRAIRSVVNDERKYVGKRFMDIPTYILKLAKFKR